jgi:hypothetical protein
MMHVKLRMGTLIFGFDHDVDEICSLLGYYAASCGNSFTDVSGQRIGPIFKAYESEEKRKPAP